MKKILFLLLMATTNIQGIMAQGKITQTAGHVQLGEFAPKFAELNDDVLFGEVWNRPGLSPHDRSMITIATLVGKGIIDSSLTHHLQFAKQNGITRTEISEMLTHIAFYAGWPNAWGAFRLAKEGLLARLRTMTAEDWAHIPDSGAGEGLPPRLERAGKQCRSLEEFIALAKPKHWTQARMRRLLVWAWLGLTREDRPDQPPYLRVLGFNSRGQAVLKEMKERAHLPILTKPAHARSLDGPSRRLFALEARCTDLYDLCLETVPAPGREWTTGVVRVESEEWR